MRADRSAWFGPNVCPAKCVCAILQKPCVWHVTTQRTFVHTYPYLRRAARSVVGLLDLAFIAANLLPRAVVLLRQFR